jgi:hypothetical protein
LKTIYLFDLGAHSLLIIQVRDQLQTQFKQSIPIVQLFKYPTISALAGYLNQSVDGEINSGSIQERVQKRKRAKQRKRVGNQKG